MTHRRITFALATVVLIAGAGWSYFKSVSAGLDMVGTADKFIATLSDGQQAVAVLDYDTPKRVGWHFIPKDYRKGLQIKDMNEQQRKAAFALLRSSLSRVGYDKSTKIMELEAVLHELEKKKPGGNIRDPERYYVTIFGKPTEKSRWGLSVEGHHLSLNFVVDGGRIVSSTPAFFGANPGTMKSDVLEHKKGLRVLAGEEQFAFDLLASLDDPQRQKAVIADKAPREIRAAGEPQPPTAPPEGIPASELKPQQTKILKKLVHEYAANMPKEVADARLQAIDKAGFDKIHFAWAGAQKPGVGHYYRVQGPTFLIEFVNTQPDAAGNPANHIHCIWRDPSGDFAVPIGG